MKVCDICGRTSKETTVNNCFGGVYCKKHSTQLRKYGKILSKTIFDANDYIIHEEYAEIILRDIKFQEIGRALIDLEDVSKCKGYKWNLLKGRKTCYARACIKGTNKRILLHRLLCDLKDTALVVDHNFIRDGLVNFKANLRVCSKNSNLLNQGMSRKGIFKTKAGTFRARIGVKGKTVAIGTFPSHEEALKARLDFEKTL